MGDLVRVDRPGDGVAVVTLNRPDKYNALSSALLAELVETLTGLAGDSGLRALVLTGAGKAFCAGIDLNELDAGTFTPAGIEVLQSFPVPVIGAINGVAVTGGLELALACDFRIAGERARFADTHSRVGVVPAWGLTARLPQAVGQGWARQMSFTGDFVDAATALRIGLVNQVVPHAELLPATMKVAHAVAEQPRDMVITLRADWNESVGVPVGEGRRVHTRHAIAGGFGGNRGEEIAARREAVLARSREQRAAD
jgi:enoyl-CoA hydratase